MEQKTIDRLNEELKAPFPKDKISWRAQSLTQAGDKAMALAYIDARDVMNRLDEVCGVDGWSDSYLDSGKRTYCTLQLLIPSTDGVSWGWVSKSDAAGDTAVESEKGAVSDSFKRAAVKWGIGRYLYDLPAPWVPCETYEKNGKKIFSKFKESPWNYVKNVDAPIPKKITGAANKQLWEVIVQELDETNDWEELQYNWLARTNDIAQIRKSNEEAYIKLVERKDYLEAEFAKMENN